MKKAFKKITTGRPRPVEIEIPPEALSEFSHVQNYKKTKIQLANIDKKSLNKASKILSNAKRPVIWAGGGVNISGASAELLALAEYLQAPVLTTFEGKGAISDKHYLSIGTPQGRSTGSSKDPLRDFFYTCDVILAVGTRFAKAEAKPSQQVVQIDVDLKEIGRNHKKTFGILADARIALTQLLKTIKSKTKSKTNQRNFFEKMKLNRYNNRATQVEPLWSYVQALRNAIPHDGILVTDMTSIAYYSRVYYHTYIPRSYFTSSYSGNLGSAFPTSLGVKIAKPKQTVVSISGDGGFLFNSQELATAVQFGINVIAVVFNDNSYGNVKRDMKKMFNNKNLGSDLINPDFVKLADSYGVAGFRVNSPKSLEETLKKAITLNKTALIEVSIGETLSPFIVEMATKD